MSLSTHYEAPAEVDEVDASPMLPLLVRALSELTEREQDVLRTTMLFWKPGEDHQRLPNDESKALALRWGTTATNIRAIRSRAMGKLKSRVEQILREEHS